jgi:tRNA (guanine-N7-)-methyltransferase
MPRAKTPKFNAFNTQNNCFDWFKNETGFTKYLRSDGPFTVEVGCGKAELLLELARKYPSRKFIGVDIKSDRLYRPGKTAILDKLTNVTFIRAHAANLSDIFKPESVDELWLTFPDPFPKKRSAKHRLTHSTFIALYHQLLSPGGRILFKTDNLSLFMWSIDEIQQSGLFKIVKTSYDLHSEIVEDDEVRIQTTFERRFISQGLKINYLELVKLSRAH